MLQHELKESRAREQQHRKELDNMRGQAVIHRERSNTSAILQDIMQVSVNAKYRSALTKRGNLILECRL